MYFINIFFNHEIAFRHLDKFNSLCIDDQKRLLQTCCAELLLLRSAKHFDSLKEEWEIQLSSNPNKNNQVKLSLDIMKVKESVPEGLHLSYLEFYETVKKQWREVCVFKKKKNSFSHIRLAILWRYFF